MSPNADWWFEERLTLGGSCGFLVFQMSEGYGVVSSLKKL